MLGWGGLARLVNNPAEIKRIINVSQSAIRWDRTEVQMPWVDDYKKKLVTAEEAVSAIKSSDRIYISGNAATP